MKRALLVALLVVGLLGAFALAPQSALAWGPCNGPYGGYAGCSQGGYYGGYSGGYYGGYSGGYYGGYSGGCNGPYGGYAGCSMGGYNGGYSGGYSSGYSSGYGYNRVCYWVYYWGYPHLACSYVRVPQYPSSGYYGYSGSYYRHSWYGGY